MLVRTLAIGLACYLAACAAAAAFAVNSCGSPTKPGDKDCLTKSSYRARGHPIFFPQRSEVWFGGQAMQFLNPARFGAEQFIFESDVGRGAPDGSFFSQAQWLQDFTEGHGIFVKSGDRATLDGVLVEGRRFTSNLGGNEAGAFQLADYDKRFAMQLEFAYRGDGLGNAGAAGPLLEWPPVNYVENGGPVDPNNWSYFDLTGGTLTGEGFYTGLELSLYQLTYPFQSNAGGAFPYSGLGLSSYFGYTVTALDTRQSGFLAQLAEEQTLFLGWDSGKHGLPGEMGALHIDWDIVPVAEPAGFGLLVGGILALAAGRRRVRPAAGAPAGC